MHPDRLGESKTEYLIEEAEEAKQRRLSKQQGGVRVVVQHVR